MPIYRLDPTVKNYIWGGTRLLEHYGKKGCAPLAESWELSFHPDGLTKLSDGRTLQEALAPLELGKNCADFKNFPLLVKLIDAAQPLSVQVHPSDEYALANENSYGKTELWYIVEANEGAGIYLGFKRKTSEEEIREAIASDRFETLLNFVPVRKGECYFIPAGTVHAIGAGCLICEVQQNSNLTYRIYDYGRRDAMGNPRELHIEKALDVMDCAPYRAVADFLPIEGETTLGLSRYFYASIISVREQQTVCVDDASFLALFCVCGDGSVAGEYLSCGDSVFLTAGMGDVTLKGNADFVAVSVRKYKAALFSEDAILSDDLGRVHAKAENLETLLSKYALTKEAIEVC